MQKYDTIVIGAGPAGIFTALKLSENKNLKILLLEQGKNLKNRKCYEKTAGKCLNCKPCSLISGWGGSGAFSDGKLLFSDKIGGWLNEYLGKEDYRRLISQSEEMWLRFGAPQKLYGTDKKAVEKINKKARKAGLEIIDFPLRHMGSDGGSRVLENIYQFLKDKITIRFNAKVEDLIIKDNKVKGVVLKNNEKIQADYVCLAPGRAGSSWLLKIAEKYGLQTDCNPVDLGVRVEIPDRYFSKIAKTVYELKAVYKTRTFKDKVRTFCVCPGGEVTMEHLNGDLPVKTVNGHSLADKKTKNMNFALLVSTKFTTPFKDPIVYARSIARLSNLLSEGIVVQRLKDLMLGQRSTPARIRQNRMKPSLKSAIPGDLAFVLPYRHLTNIIETLQALDRIIPGVWGDQTLLYGVEIKLYSSRIRVNKNLETKIKNLYTAGDGAGLTRGLVHASVSGLAVARNILKKIF